MPSSKMPTGKFFKKYRNEKKCNAVIELVTYTCFKYLQGGCIETRPQCMCTESTQDDGCAGEEDSSDDGFRHGV